MDVSCGDGLYFLNYTKCLREPYFIRSQFHDGWDSIIWMYKNEFVILENFGMEAMLT